MGLIKRYKQLAVLVGTGVILAGVGLAGFAAYLWWDTRNGTDDFDTDFEADTDHGTDTDFEAETDFETDSDVGTDGDAAGDETDTADEGTTEA